MEPITEDVPHRIRQRLGQKTYDFLLNTAKVAGVLSLALRRRLRRFSVPRVQAGKAHRRDAVAVPAIQQSAVYRVIRKRVDIALLEPTLAEIANAAGDEAQLAMAIKKVMQKEQAEPDLAFIFNFFDTVVYCAAKNICDPDITFDLFHASAHRVLRAVLPVHPRAAKFLQ